MQHARGQFDVSLKPLTESPAAGLSAMSLDKHYHGDLEATAKGEFLSAGDPKAGVAGYVAMEQITGALHGRRGSFALQQSAIMDASTHKLEIIVVPGSGTGELQGIRGELTITNINGQHSYDLSYTLPD